jgi:DinB superfamily
VKRIEDAMAEIDTALAASRDAVDQLIRAGEQSGAAWIAPRAPGKWSPSQIVEHVARNLEESANIAAGRPSTVRTPPAVVRPIARLIFRRVLRKAAFPKGFKAHKALNPASGPATPAEGRIRLETAHQKFDEVCRRIAADGRLMTTGFGSVPVQDYVRFQELHTRPITVSRWPRVSRSRAPRADSSGARRLLRRRFSNLVCQDCRLTR